MYVCMYVLYILALVSRLGSSAQPKTNYPGYRKLFVCGKSRSSWLKVSKPTTAAASHPTKSDIICVRVRPLNGMEKLVWGARTRRRTRSRTTSRSRSRRPRPGARVATGGAATINGQRVRHCPCHCTAIAIISNPGKDIPPGQWIIFIHFDDENQLHIRALKS